jgi:hypothetical protein
MDNQRLMLEYKLIRSASSQFMTSTWRTTPQRKKKLTPMTDNQRSKSQQNLSSASPQRKLGFSLWVPERAQRVNLAPQDNPRFKSEKTHHLLHQSHCEIPGGGKKPWRGSCSPEQQPKIQITVQQVIICLLPSQKNT